MQIAMEKSMAANMLIATCIDITWYYEIGSKECSI